MSLFLFMPFIKNAQVTFTKDIAPIIYNHCSSCHRQGEIGPMAFTNYEQIKNWGPMIRYVTSQKTMPPWKADPTYSRFMDENFLSDQQISTISSWVDNGMPYGQAQEEPPFPVFPENSLLGQPDLVLSFAQKHIHKGNGQDEYRYFVLPTGLTEDKKVKAVELRPGNSKIVHHALFFNDDQGKARSYDEQTPEYGFEGFGGFGVNEVLNYPQYPGYVPGQKARYFPDQLAQEMKKNSDLVIQMHYAPFSVDEADSSSVNIFFAKEDETIERIVTDYIMLPTNLVGGPQTFFILPGQTKVFHGIYTVPFDVSLIGIFPHMHYLGQNWEVYIENTDGTKQNLIRINDWDFNWQGGYYFDRYKIAKKGSKIHAFAKYDNTAQNPNNPSNPPRFVTWGEGSKDEMYYLPLLYVPYKNGDENVIFQDNTSSSNEVNWTADQNENKIIKVFPNPLTDETLHVYFQLNQGMPVDIEIVDINGKIVRTMKKGEYFHSGQHILHINNESLMMGNYFIVLKGINFVDTKKLSIW